MNYQFLVNLIYKICIYFQRYVFISVVGEEVFFERSLLVNLILYL